MKFTSSVFLLLSFGFPALVSGSPRECPSPPAALNRGSNILIVGDSNTFRVGYADLVQAAFMPGDVAVSGTSGIASPHFLPGQFIFDRLALDARTPEIVTILLGTNDAQGKTSPEVFATRFVAVATALIDFGVKEVILIIPPRRYFFGQEQVAENALLAEYRRKILSICEEMDRVTCGPDLFMELSKGDLAVEFNYQIHLNQEGHRKVFELLMPLLEDDLPDEFHGHDGVGSWRREAFRRNRRSARACGEYKSRSRHLAPRKWRRSED